MVYSTTKFHCFRVKNESKSIGFENDFDEILEKELLLQKRIEPIKKVMENINSNQKKCVELFYFDGFSYSVIFNDTEFSIQEVISLIHIGINIIIPLVTSRMLPVDHDKKIIHWEIYIIHAS